MHRDTSRPVDERVGRSARLLILSDTDTSASKRLNPSERRVPDDVDRSSRSSRPAPWGKVGPALRRALHPGVLSGPPLHPATTVSRSACARRRLCVRGTPVGEIRPCSGRASHWNHGPSPFRMVRRQFARRRLICSCRMAEAGNRDTYRPFHRRADCRTPSARDQITLRRSASVQTSTTAGRPEVITLGKTEDPPRPRVRAHPTSTSDRLRVDLEPQRKLM